MTHHARVSFPAGLNGVVGVVGVAKDGGGPQIFIPPSQMALH